MYQRIFTSGINRNRRIVPVASVPVVAPDIEDTFTRANSVTIGTTEIGSLTWTESGDPRIVSNAVENGSSVTASFAYVNSGQTSCTVEATLNLKSDGGTRSCGIMYRINSTSNYWYAFLQKTGAGAGSLVVQRVVSGITTDLVSQAFTITANTDYEMTVELIGNTHSISIDGTLQGTFSNTQWNTEVQHGVRVASGIGTSKVDNFRVYF